MPITKHSKVQYIYIFLDLCYYVSIELKKSNTHYETLAKHDKLQNLQICPKSRTSANTQNPMHWDTSKFVNIYVH
jgi:hypothetical protein